MDGWRLVLWRALLTIVALGAVFLALTVLFTLFAQAF